MFLEFQKITTAKNSRMSPIIVNSAAIMRIEADTFEDKENRTTYDATRIEVIGFPKYTFFTMTPMNMILNKLSFVDMTSGNPGQYLGVMYPNIEYPLIKAPRIFNNTITESDNYAFNPSYLIYSEEFSFNDAVLGTTSTGMMIVLTETSPIKILTNVSYTDLFNILLPVKI